MLSFLFFLLRLHSLAFPSSSKINQRSSLHLQKECAVFLYYYVLRLEGLESHFHMALSLQEVVVDLLADAVLANHVGHAAIERPKHGLGHLPLGAHFAAHV
mmetsp:Transcript_14819/g.20443  ORF Transcript_14819/g.20443 Transcript_14819/m.20443 type:complete len:101 (+) Transcript_14819:248-550(+)